MNSREAAYDEEDQLRRAIEASKELVVVQDEISTRRNKRGRSDSEEYVNLAPKLHDGTGRDMADITNSASPFPGTPRASKGSERARGRHRPLPILRRAIFRMIRMMVQSQGTAPPKSPAAPAHKKKNPSGKSESGSDRRRQTRGKVVQTVGVAKAP